MTRDQHLLPKSQKLRLSPMQGHVLRMLESVGAAEMATALNTLWGLYGDTEREAFLLEAEGAIRHLHRLAFITFEACESAIPPQPDEIEHHLRFGDRFHWDSSRECWSWGSDDEGHPTIDLVLTEAGLQTLRR